MENMKKDKYKKASELLNEIKKSIRRLKRVRKEIRKKYPNLFE